MKSRMCIAWILIALFTFACHPSHGSGANEPPIKVRLRLSEHEIKVGDSVTLIEIHDIPVGATLIGKKYKLELLRFTSHTTAAAVYLDDTELRNIPYTGFFKQFPGFELGSGPFLLERSGKHEYRTKRAIEPLIPGWYLISGSYEYKLPDGSKKLIVANNSCLLVVLSDGQQELPKGMQVQLQALEDAVTRRSGDSIDGIP